MLSQLVLENCETASMIKAFLALILIGIWLK